METVSSTVKHAEVPTAAKWSIRSVRGGPVGDVIWVFAILDMAGSVLKEIKVTKSVGEALDMLQPDAIVKKIFGCKTQKNLKKD